MINLQIKTDGKDVMDSLDNSDCTLEETAIVVYRLEQMKQTLIEKEFKSKFMVEGK